MFRQRPAGLFFEEAKKKNIGIIVRVPLASGLLTGKMKKDTEFSKDDHRNFNRHGEAFDVGETFADGHPEGFIKVITTKKGKILGVTIVGETASEIIYEWVLAIQKRLSMLDIMMMQLSFPTIAMLNKMVAEDWMMGKLKSPWIGRIARMFI